MSRIYNRKISETVDGSTLEVESDQSIETPASTEFSREMQEEKFMNEPVTILLAETSDENARPYADFSVNGRTMPILRGVPTTVRRMFVEAIARCKETKSSQKTYNPMEPDRITLVERTVPVFPMEILEDKNPKGRAWLNAVLAEPA